MKCSPDALPTVVFEWGSIKWLITPDAIDGASTTFGEVIVNPSMGHAPHTHPGADEVIYVVAGEARQTVGEETFDLRAGEAAWIPRGVEHSTYNVGWQPLRLIVTYTPGGEERSLTELPDYSQLPVGSVPVWAPVNEGEAK